MNERRTLWHLDEDCIFLNHGSFGACPKSVLAVQSSLREQLERQPLRFMLRELPDLLAQVRSRMAQFLGADEEGLVFVPNATFAVNSVLRSLDLAPGDELVATSHGYNACNNVLRYVAEKSGAKVVIADLPFPIRGPEEAVEAIMKVISEKTKLVLLDHVTSSTALVLPVAEICQQLRERSVLSVIDGAHAPGMIDYNLNELGCDFHTGNAHKWICAPKGAAYLWARPEHRDWLRPAVISHGANAPTEKRSRYHWEFDWTGTYDPTAILSIPAALDFMDRLSDSGIRGVAEANHDLVARGRALILNELKIDAPCPSSMLGSIATIPLPPESLDIVEDHFATTKLQDRLLFDYKIEVPVGFFPRPPDRWLRISAQAYNEIGDYEKLAAALDAILKLDRFELESR